MSGPFFRVLDLKYLPTLNASLNALSALFLTAGYVFIKKKNIAAHRFCMASAFGTSALFLVSYLTYHFHAGATRFTGTGWTRPVYFSILISHTVLATAVAPLIIVSLSKALRENFSSHAQWARVTWPVWMYVSLTGVLVYVMLYHSV